MSNISYGIRGNKTHFSFLVPENLRCIRVCGKYSRASQATDDSITRSMRIAYWIPKATDTHQEYVILIVFPQKQWLRERALLLRYAYIACLVYIVGVQEEPSKSKVRSHYIANNFIKF